MNFNIGDLVEWDEHHHSEGNFSWSGGIRRGIISEVTTDGLGVPVVIIKMASGTSMIMSGEFSQVLRKIDDAGPEGYVVEPARPSQA